MKNNTSSSNNGKPFFLFINELMWKGSGLLNSWTKYCELHGFGTVAVGDIVIDCPWVSSADACPICYRTQSENKRTSSYLILCSTLHNFLPFCSTVFGAAGELLSGCC